MLKTHLRNLSSGDCAYRRNNGGIKKCFILNIFDGIFQSFIQIAVFRVTYKSKEPTMDLKGVSSPLPSICIVRTITCDHAILN